MTTVLDGSTHDAPALISGTFDVGADTTLDLQGYVQDTGALSVGGASGHPATVLIDGTVTLFGLGGLGLGGGQSIVTGINAAAKLVNENDTISGTGLIGHGQLNLDNQSGGEIVSNLSSAGGITIDTGASGAFTNEGQIVSNGSAGLVIVRDFVNTGTLEASAGTLFVEGNVSGHGGAFIDGGTIEFGNLSDNVVTFSGTGTLALDNPANFSGKVAGITGTGNVLDFHGFNFADTIAATGASSYDSATGQTTLTVTDASDNKSVALKLVGDYSLSIWTVSDDHHGGANVVDPPATPSTSTNITASQPNQTLTGTGGNDNFVFTPNFGNATITNYAPGATRSRSTTPWSPPCRRCSPPPRSPAMTCCSPPTRTTRSR